MTRETISQWLLELDDWAPGIIDADNTPGRYRFALNELLKAMDERDNLLAERASITDLANSWAREMSIEEAPNENGLRALIDRLWGVLSRRLTELRDERDAMAAALADAREMVADWAQYANPYFREKHGLQKDLDTLDAALAGSSQLRDARDRKKMIEGGRMALEELGCNCFGTTDCGHDIWCAIEKAKTWEPKP